MKKIGKTGVQIGLVLVLVLALALGTAVPGAKASIDNHVNLDFSTAYWHTADGDLVVEVDNVSLPGSRKSTGAGINNPPDVPPPNDAVVAPQLTFAPAAGVTVESVSKEDLVSYDPYIWHPPDIAQDEGLSRFARISAEPPHHFEFAPGFSAKRTLSQIDFTAKEPPVTETQTLTIEATPAVDMDELRFGVRIMEDEPVNAKINTVIISPTGAGDIHISDDKRRVDIKIVNPDAATPTTYTASVTIDVELKDGVSSASFKPRVFVWASHFVASGDVQDTTVSRSMELGTWTWETAPNEYSWHWTEQHLKLVMFPEIQRNRVHTSFGTHYTYRTACDSVENIFIEQSAWIHSDMHNSDDETGADVVGPSVGPNPAEPLYGPILELDPSGTVTNVRDEYLVSGSEYTWHFPGVIQCQGFGGGADIAGTAKFWTDFSVERDVDQRRFTAPGTQILTLSVTPAVDMPRLKIDGRTDFDEVDIATFHSVELVSGDGAGMDMDIHSDGRGFWLQIDEPVVDQTYVWEIEIDINSLSGYQALEYMPRIHVKNVVASDDGRHWGSSLSSGESYALDGTLLGTWEWQATGEYSWHWNQEVAKQVELMGYATPVYPVPTQDAINTAIDKGLEWLRDQQQPDGAWYWRDPDQPEEKPNVGMTGLAVWSLLHGLVPQTDEQVQAGIDFILSQQVTNPYSDDYGAIHTGHETYETALAILALRATNNPIYLDEMTLAADYLARSQNDEGVDFPNVGYIDDTHWAYGGWSYGYGNEEGIPPWPAEPEEWDARADLSCTQFAMIGLKAAEEAGVVLSHDTWGEVWRKAQIYVTRCQNPDGGFAYQPPDSPRGAHGSSGRMTAAGVWCLRLAGVPVYDPGLPEDTRVQDGLDWLECRPALAAEHHFYYYYLWTAAKAFTMCERPAELTDGTWYADFAGYLVANQEGTGQWLSLGWPEDRESHLNATQYALLVLERAVLPPPPGIPWETFQIDLMKILFDRSPNHDKIEIKGRFQLEEGASYNLDEDTVTVTIGGVVITIPPGSFVGSAGKYEYKLEGQPKIGMKLNFNDGTWSLKVGNIDASAIDSSDGIPVVDVNVTLMIGYMLAGQNVPTWCNDLVYP